MSGHSKWHNIKHTKNKKDAKKSKKFSKFSAKIASAVRKGGDDPEKNSDLQFAIEKAKDINMPKDTIKRAIKRGKGELGSGGEQKVLYEGFGPGGIGVIIKATTDNKNRTVAAIRKIFSKSGGNLGEKNSVLWMFEKKGLIKIAKNELKDIDKDEFELSIIDAGVEDINENEKVWKIYTKVKLFDQVKEKIKEKNIKIKDSKLGWFAKNTKDIDKKDKKRLKSLLNDLAEMPDIDNVYTNLASI